MALPLRCGNVKNAEKFDAQFFEIDDMSADSTDPQLRMFYEVVYEAIFDAGIIPNELKQSNTAIVLGLCNIDSRALITDQIVNENSKVPMYTRKTPANLSQFFEFTGPAFEIDSACASSFSALFEGIQYMKSGQCDKLVIGGSTLHLSPYMAWLGNDLKILALDGRSKCLDASGDGFCRSEAVVAILVERKKDAKRIYATIQDIQTNTDGYTLEGITFPGVESQRSLMQSVIRNIKLDPLTVNYIECHITGTVAGDKTECQSLLDAYRNGSDKSIMFGCLKSNMGHSEETSALCAIAKVALIFQKHCIPPNRNYKTPTPNIPALTTGQIIPVLQKTSFHGDVIPINSFGLGGVNTHAVVTANDKRVTQNSFKIVEKLPRLVNISGRTEEGLEYATNWIENNRTAISKEFLALLNDVSKTPLETGMHCRAFMLFDEESVLHKQVFREEERRPLWFVFAGLDSQWKGMLNEVASFPVIAESLQKCAEVLATVGVDLLCSKDIECADVDLNIITAMVSIVSVQVALVDLLRYMGLKPDGIIGYSIGEISAAYADGCLTLEETVLTAFYKAKFSSDSQKEKGAMAKVGLNWEEGLSKCFTGVSPACDNSANLITVAGSEAGVIDFMEQAKQKKLSATPINSCEMEYHSSLMESSFHNLVSCLENVIRNPKLKSNKMISTSNNLAVVQCDATYFASNIVSPVMFRKAVSKIPQNACVVEVNSSALLLPILQRDIPNSVTLALMKHDCGRNIENILSGIGHIYCTGNNVNIEKLYPKVEYPVPRETLSLSHLLKWDHSKSHFLAHYTHMSNNRKARDTKSIDIMSKEWSFIEGHCVDRRILFPATGYLYLVWCQYTRLMTGNTKFTFPVEFKNVIFKRATVISNSATYLFDIAINETTGRFTIVEDGSVCITGYIGFADCTFNYSHSNSVAKETNVVTLKQEEIYKEFRIRGYDYGKSFQLLEEATANGCYGKVSWTGNWITFMDAVFQLTLFASKERSLILPTSIDYLMCNPKIFFETTEYENYFDIIFNEEVNQITTNGVYIKGLKGTTIQRRADQVARLTHEFFAPYYLTVETTREKQALVEEYFEKCVILLQKLFLKEFHVTPEEENSSFNIDSHDGYSFYKRLMVALNEKVSFERFFETLTKHDQRSPIFEANFEEMVIVQFKQIMENMTETLFILEVNETESELKESVINSVENYLMSCEYNLQKTFKINMIPSNMNDVNILIYKDVSTELITDEKVLKEEEAFSTLLNSFEKLLVEDGFLLLTYRTKLTSLEKEIFNLRNLPHPQLLTENNIRRSISKCFTLIGKRSDDFGVVSCILKKNRNPRLPLFIKPQYDSYKWVEEIKSVLKEDKQNVIWLMANESEFHGVIGLTRCLKKEHAKRFRCFISNEEFVPDFVLKNDLIMNYFKNGCYGVNIHQEFVVLKKHIEHSHLDIKTKGDLGSLGWHESCHNHSYRISNDENEAKLITVYYSALNYKDVMIASGKIAQNAYPPLWHKDGCLGSEYSGIDENGNRVMGIAKVNSIATTIIANENDLCWSVPNNWSLEEAATVPFVYLTVYYALIVRGKLKQYEKVLIHSGSGGVGQAAITVCLSMNCEVFTSVETEQKKEFLKNKFPQLQERQFVNTRSSSFEEHILKVTCGEGVDVILNSFSEEKFRASINCLAEFGRFIEIGKFDIIQNNSLDPSLFQRNQCFHTICVAHLLEEFAANTTEINELYSLVQTNLNNGNIKPLFSSVFEINEVEKAFTYLASKEHIGKVLIRIRDENTGIIPKPTIISSTSHAYCDPRKVYILFGGLGGIGLEVAVWLSSRGATKLVITSRKGINNSYQEYIKNRIESSGVFVKIVVNDASTYEKTRAIFKEALDLGPIGGIFNLSLVLKNALIQDQTAESFESVCMPKINTSLYSDQISREIVPNPDYFVCFSSLVSFIGTVGQSNYGFANSVMENICEKRRNDGLHAVAIQYGPVGDTGAFNEMAQSNDIIFEGCHPQRIPSLLDSLDKCMNSNYAVCCSTVMAPKSTLDENRNFLKTVCHILRVDYASSLDENVNLLNMGLDSLMALEVKQAFEHEYNVVISTDEVRKLTIKEIKNLSNNNLEKQV